MTTRDRELCRAIVERWRVYLQRHGLDDDYEVILMRIHAAHGPSKLDLAAWLSADFFEFGRAMEPFRSPLESEKVRQTFTLQRGMDL